MEIVKKNLISIICGVVALAAVGVALVMVPSKQQDLQKQLDGSKQTYQQLSGLLHKQRTLPVVKPDSTAEKPLEQFPSEQIIAQGDQITKLVEKESTAMSAAAVAMNQHPLLVPGCLPNPTNTAAYQFSIRYREVMPLPTGPGMSAQPPQAPGAPDRGNPTTQSVFARALNAGMPPNVDELNRKQQAKAEQIRRDNTLISGQGGGAINQQAVDAMVKEQTAELPRKLLQDVAAGSSIYISPDTFEVSPQVVNSASSPDAVTIFITQLDYWIQQDAVNAIRRINGTSTKIDDSVVKNLISVRVDTGGTPIPVMAAGAPSANDDPDAQLKTDYTFSPTGRVCNGMYDVYHFTIKADVEAGKLPEFLRGLGTDQFITPIGVDVRAVDNASALAQGHLYGNTPMVNVTARCEVLYLRKWDAPLMPDQVKQKFGITVNQPGTGTAQQASAVTP